MSDFRKSSVEGLSGANPAVATSGAVIVSFAAALVQRRKDNVYRRWVAYYQRQEHQDLLDALVYEHENQFPLRSSSDELDQVRHKALLEVLQERAHSDFLKKLVSDLRTE